MKSKSTTHTYTVLGNPIGLFKVNDEASTPGIWNDYKQARCIYVISLEKQHDDLPLFYGAIKVEAKFFMQLSSYKNNAPTLKDPHIKAPALLNLFNFINNACVGTIYKKACIITAIEITKQYDKNPRTEITITTREK